MDLLLTEQQSLFADTAARLCADYGGPKRLRTLQRSQAEFDAEAWRAAIAGQWLATLVAEPHGGHALGAFDLALALEAAGRRLLLLPLMEAAAVARTLSRAAAGPGAPSALVDLLAGARLIVPATEAASWRFDGRSSNLRYDADGSRLQGSIPFVPYASAADAFLVALDAAAPCLAIVPRAQVSVMTERNVDGSTASTLDFAEVRIPAEHVIATGDAARRLAVGLQELLTLGAAVELVGLAAAALDITLDYIKLRRQFGRPIGSFQVLQHRAVNCFVDLELNRSLIYRVLAAHDAGEHHPAMVSAVKARASRVALDTVRAALQMHGAIGYTEEHDIGLYYKRAVALAVRYGGELGHTSAFSALTLPSAGASP